MNICDMYDAHEFLDYLGALNEDADRQREAEAAKNKRTR